MTTILFYSIICFFSIYSLGIIISKLLGLSLCENTTHIESLHTVLYVKNQADSIESTVRTLALQSMLLHNSPNIVIVDLGSTDETFEILLRLTHEYEFLCPMNRNSYIELIGNM